MRRIDGGGNRGRCRTIPPRFLFGSEHKFASDATSFLQEPQTFADSRGAEQGRKEEFSFDLGALY